MADPVCTLHLPQPSAMRVVDGQMIVEVRMSQADVVAVMRELAEHLLPEPDWRPQFVEDLDRG